MCDKLLHAQWLMILLYWPLDETLSSFTGWKKKTQKPTQNKKDVWLIGAGPTEVA